MQSGTQLRHCLRCGLVGSQRAVDSVALLGAWSDGCYRDTSMYSLRTFLQRKSDQLVLLKGEKPRRGKYYGLGDSRWLSPMAPRTTCRRERNAGVSRGSGGSATR
eukprot:5451153-Pyramimonas_sp.AAC.1